MRYIELEGKKYALKGRFGAVKKILEKYNLMQLKENGWGKDEKVYIDFVLDSTWNLVQRKRFFKPYVFFWWFKKRVLVSELMAAQSDILSILYGIPEDKIKSEDIEEEKKSPTKKGKEI